MHAQRVELYKKLEQTRDSKVILFVTGDRPQLETQIGKEALSLFVHHLDIIDHARKITVFLYTNGGDVIASWSIANLVRQFCDEFEVIVSDKALSGGTLICLGANTIVMTKQAALGPIDPSTSSPLNPQVPGAPPHVRVPVSVEAINGYLDFARQALGDRVNLEQAFLNLANQIHPIVLGQAFRTRAQIRMLGKKLLARHRPQGEDLAEILQFLCSESGSHDYTITRQEARETLGLNVETPTDELYQLIHEIHEDFAAELELRNRYDPGILVATVSSLPYSFKRALIESVSGGSHVFLSEGTLSKHPFQAQPGIPPQHAIADN